jgi:predicted HD phosphohydrolase
MAEYLFESGLSESFTSSALLHDIIEHLLSEYNDGLVDYEKS